MQKISISPIGPIEFSDMKSDGTAFVRIALVDPREGMAVDLTFELAAFVSFADTVTMIAQEVIKEYGPPVTE